MPQLSLGSRRPQRVKKSLVITLPKVWTGNFNENDLVKVNVFTDENLDLIIKVPITKKREVGP